MKFLTTIFCVLAMVALYGCGGSSFLSELASDQEGFVSVRIDGTGNSGSSAFVDKATVRDSTPGTGDILAASDLWSIDGQCGFFPPTISPASTANEISLVQTPNPCTLPSCCEYTVTAGDSCSIVIDCHVFSGVTDLNIATLNFNYDVYQAMATNTPSGVGTASIIVDSDQWVDQFGDTRFDLTVASLDRSDCTGLDPDKFELVFDDPFLGGTYENYVDKVLFRNTDSIGIVNLNASGYSTCMLHFQASTQYDLVGLTTGVEINETGQLIEAKMQMCDYEDEVLCGMNSLHP